MAPGAWTSLAWLLGKLAALGAAGLLLRQAGHDIFREGAEHVFLDSGLVLGALLIVGHHWRTVEGRKLADLGFHPRLRGLGSGLLAGLAGVALTSCLSLLAGWAVPRAGASLPDALALLSLLALALGIAVLEEALFRGVLLGIMLRGLPWTTAFAANACLFAAAHFLGPGSRTLWDAATTFIGLWATGVTLAWAAVRRGLWFPVGVHACWIVAITGSARFNPLIFLPHGHIWTGNGFPPRGLLGILAMLALLFLLGSPGHSEANKGQLAA